MVIGMSKNDLKMCFERHATSKIKDIEDIFKIKTMGFRVKLWLRLLQYHMLR